MADVGFARGTQAEYDAKLANSQIDNNTTYWTTDTHRIYLGTQLMGGGNGDILQLVPQTSGATIEDGVGLKIVNVNFTSLYNTFNSAIVSRVVLNISSDEILSFNFGEFDLDRSSIYLYAFYGLRIYYITLTGLGNDMVGTLSIFDFNYPNGDEVSY